MTTKQKGPLKGFTVGSFPLYDEQVRQLVRSHKKLKEHPLYLAVWYDKDDPKDIRILEAIGEFPPSDEPGLLFTTEFEASSQFLIAGGGQLVLTLADPDELRRAIEGGYELVKRVQSSFARGQADSLYCARPFRDLLKALKGEE